MPPLNSAKKYVEMTLVSVYALLWLPVLPVQCSCSSSVEGLVLRKHAFRSFVTSDLNSCYQACKGNEICQSINFYRDTKLCEINNRTRIVRREDVDSSHINGIYFDNPSRAMLGSSTKLPALSCEEIKQSFQSAPSGRYWMILPDKGHITTMYCDMHSTTIVNCNPGSCKNNATCDYHGNGKFNCNCLPGYSGRYCEADIPVCDTLPCKNGGVCTDGPGAEYICTCSAPFVGENCEVNSIPECNNYSQLNGPDRLVTLGDVTHLCDRSLTLAWYRFTGSSGVKMPETKPPSGRCNTDATGWLNGRHPSTKEGVVTRQVCFHWSGNPCKWTKNIRIRNCGLYFVYELGPPPHCSLRYCTTS